MLERHEGDTMPEDERSRPDPKPEVTAQDETAPASDRDYQAGFWSPPN